MVNVIRVLAELTMIPTAARASLTPPVFSKRIGSAPKTAHAAMGVVIHHDRQLLLRCEQNRSLKIVLPINGGRTAALVTHSYQD